MLHAESKGVAMYKCRWLWTVAYAAFALIALAGCYGEQIQAVLEGGPASTWQEESLHRNDGGYIGAQPPDREDLGLGVTSSYRFSGW